METMPEELETLDNVSLKQFQISTVNFLKVGKTSKLKQERYTNF